MSNDQLERWVGEELYFDPSIDGRAIAVKADDGRVTLRGSVGSFGEKRTATRAAQRVYGVKSVDNELEVKLMTTSRREDAELRGDILQALVLDSLVPDTVDARVQGGRVTLSGTAAWQYQKDEAEHVAGNVRGVVAVHDEIALEPPEPKADDVKREIKRALKRNAKLDAKAVDVKTRNGSVSLSGTVSSWSEHDAAVAAAWAAPGVTAVDDNLVVDY
jgi:osmotically-inducible protein OsmY